MESNEPNIKFLRNNQSKNSKASNGKSSNFINNKSFNQYNIKRKNNKQFQRNYNTNSIEARNGSISDRIANTETLNSNSSEFAVFILVLIGSDVELKLIDNRVYRGIFHSISKREGSSEQFVCIRFCRRILDLYSNELSKPIEDYCMFPLDLVYRLSTTNINGIPTRFDSVSGELKGSKMYGINSFRTDNEISNDEKRVHERTLKPWVSEDHSSNIIEDVLGNEPFDCWDQFEENRNKFGVQGTYDENLYTTPLDFNEISEEEKRRAEILANEIEREQKGDSPNKFENEIIGSTIENDEEMNFSSVHRNISDQNNSNKDANSELKTGLVDAINQSKANNKHAKVAEELSSKDPLSKNHKSKFSFNPNAKEFLPRSISNYPKVCEDHLNNFDNIRAHETMNHSHEYRNDNCHYSQRNMHFTHSNVYRQHHYDNQLDHNNLDLSIVNATHSKGSQFRDSLGIDISNETSVNPISYDEYYLINIQRADNVGSREGGHRYPAFSCDTSNAQPIYYYAAESEDIQSSAYYISDYNSGKWSNYSIHNQYYIPSNNSEVYNHYCNYQGRGTYY
ncbi:polyadenylate-binding -interacting 4 isoform X2 [Cryptosporidium sp. chipmunk genotype I]|uniref:polyadenylate-binding -interacting 4 isoform X2 n=1 Tax=Cryptosporidium sp. chipmunk genotype I TaxID=1280935 RepID=UPI00351A8DE0|nr:polyadenylate-binding -interacting 4 isoform X2 [Cryptosporidium sp. chipmunk genotype I]